MEGAYKVEGRHVLGARWWAAVRYKDTIDSQIEMERNVIAYSCTVL